MVELPWDDAKTRFEELAQKFDSFALTFNEGAKGALADAMEERVKAVNEFTSAVAMAIMDRPAASAAAQHAADEVLRDAPKPAEVRKAEVEAAFMTLRAKQSIIPLPQAAAYEQKAQELRSRREEAYEFHTDASSVNAPNFIATPPPLPELAGAADGSRGHGNSGTSGYPGGNGGQGASGGGSGAGAPGSGSVTGGSGSGGSLGGGSVGDSEIGTETSSDGLGAGAGGMQQPMMGQQPMQGQPQAGAAGANPAAFGQQPGMLGGPGYTSPSAADAMRRNRDKDKRNHDLATGLTGAAGGAAAVMGGAAAAGVDRGVSVSGVNTKADTSGLGTNLSGANGPKPGSGTGPGGMLGRAPMGMVGPMAGAGAGAGGTTKEKPDIKPGVKDAALHGTDELKDAVPGGLVGRDTAEPEDETGVDRFFDKEEWKRKNGKD